MPRIEHVFYSLVVVAVVSFCTFLAGEIWYQQTRSLGTAVIVDKSFVPSTSSSGMGFTHGSDGIQPVFVSSSSPEEFTLLLRHEGRVMTKEVGMDFYANARVGDEVEVFGVFGGITGCQSYWFVRERSE